MKFMELPLEIVSSLVDQVVAVTTNTSLLDGLRLGLVNRQSSSVYKSAQILTEVNRFV